MAYDDAASHDDSIFRDLLEHHLRTAKFLRLVLVYTEHYELQAPILYCESEPDEAPPDQDRKGPSTCEKLWYAIRDSNPEPAD
jgi:hypothetical protein